MKFLVGLVVIALSVVFTGMMSGYLILNSTLNYQAPLIFEISKGETFNSALQDVAKDVKGFPMRMAKIYIKLSGLSKSLKVGEYEIPADQSARQIIEFMTKGQSIERVVTFQEGLNIFQIAEILEQNRLTTKQEFLAAARNPDLIMELLGFRADSIEGYLFPDTYKLPKSWTAEQYIRTFVSHFKKVWASVEIQNKTGMIRHQVVTLASIVEKETGAPFERPMISSVFHNRLKKSMRLQSDPTTIYGVWVQTGEMLRNITRKDLQTSTPYNTYTVNGLPKGPIANPGKAALVATMNPVESQNYFFVSRNDGTHKFSKTYKEHQEAVRQFQLDPRARQGKSWRDLNKNNSANN
ncbi:MAG: endolytic transglycosylase MltG [Bdellovibrionaceae bacterium]|nr:endolytic transglycosylase MltG [Pseudobdellovibrionaceae bacterium]